MFPLLLTAALASPASIDTLRDTRSRAAAPPCAPGSDGEQGRCGGAIGVWAPTLPEASPSGYAQAHADIAHVLGHVSVHCPVGAEIRGRTVGAFSQRIHNGWYSNVEPRMAGTHIIETLVGGEADKPEYEATHRVTWSASEAGEAVRCTIEPITWVDVTVSLRDAEGQPLAGVKVTGCGLRGQTDQEGLLVTKARDHAVCELKTRGARQDRYTYRFDPAHHTGEVLAMQANPREPSDYEPLEELPHSLELLEIYEGLAPLASTPEAEELYRHLIEHRKGHIDLLRCHAGSVSACAARKPILGTQPTPMPGRPLVP